DSRVADVPMSSNAIVVTPLSWHPFVFNGLTNGLRFSVAVEVADPGIQQERRPLLDSIMTGPVIQPSSFTRIVHVWKGMLNGHTPRSCGPGRVPRGSPAMKSERHREEKPQGKGRLQARRDRRLIDEAGGRVAGKPAAKVRERHGHGVGNDRLPSGPV